MTAVSLGTQIERAPIRREESISDVPRWWRAILSIPLIGKLAGANTIIVAAAAIMGVILHSESGDGRLLLVLVGSLMLALLVNLALVYVALRPLQELEATVKVYDPVAFAGRLSAGHEWRRSAQPLRHRSGASIAPRA